MVGSEPIVGRLDLSVIPYLPVWNRCILSLPLACIKIAEISAACKKAIITTHHNKIKNKNKKKDRPVPCLYLYPSPLSPSRSSPSQLPPLSLHHVFRAKARATRARGLPILQGQHHPCITNDKFEPRGSDR